MKKSNVRLLQFVRKGEKIGEIGATGNAMGKPHHLHFSVKIILPHFWKIDDSIQGWNKSFYLNRATQDRYSTARVSKRQIDESAACLCARYCTGVPMLLGPI